MSFKERSSVAIFNFPSTASLNTSGTRTVGIVISNSLEMLPPPCPDISIAVLRSVAALSRTVGPAISPTWI